jgi:F-type H+-transporting ATPase subunit b
MDAIALDAGLVFWTVVTFVCLVALLARFVFKPLRAMLDQREAQVRAALSDAERARGEAAELLGRNREQIEEAREEARRIVNAGHQIVAQMRSEAGENARRDAEAISARARAEIEREVQKGMDELKNTVANLSVRVAREVIGESMDETRHRQLADDFIERLKQTRATRQS